MTENATGGGALINLGDLSRPATVLIEKISDAVGGIAKPWQIVRTATAEAKAEIIRAQTRIEISEIEQRALIRMVREEGNKQANIENITATAIPLLSSDSKPETIENDWLSHFFDRCRLISDEDMQSLWANILAGQANNPGSFSKRTIDLAAGFDKIDAEMFSKFCTYVWTIRDRILPIIKNVGRLEFSESIEINYEALAHLDNIGLIKIDENNGFVIPKMPKVMELSYHGKPITIELLQENDNLFRFGGAILTNSGIELFPICGAVGSDKYFMEILDGWMQEGYLLTSPVVIC